MNLKEAEFVFDIWCNWYWPSNFIIDTVHFGKKPESYLPFPKDVLVQALDIVKLNYYSSGNLSAIKNIETSSIDMWMSYGNDDDSIQSTAKCFSNSQYIEIIKSNIARYKNQWEDYLINAENQSSIKLKSKDRAEIVFDIWTFWFMPNHFLLESIYIETIPESYLPYPIDVLEDNLEIVKNRQEAQGNLEVAESIEESLRALIFYYERDDNSLQKIRNIYINPSKNKEIHDLITSYRKYWENWLKGRRGGNG